MTQNELIHRAGMHPTRILPPKKKTYITLFRIFNSRSFSPCRMYRWEKWDYISTRLYTDTDKSCFAFCFLDTR